MARPKTITTEIFIERAIKIHGNKYDYSKTIFVRSKDKLKIICNNHGIFEQRPSHHLEGQNCPRCSKSPNIRYTYDQIIKKFTEKWGDRFIYHPTEYVNQATKFRIECRDHGIFTSQYGSHLRGNYGSCRKCANKGVAHDKKKYTTDQFIAVAKKAHKIKYDYSKTVYLNEKTNVIVICPKHGEFSTRPKVHLNGDCRHCATKSKGEDAIVVFLDKHNIEYQREISFEDCRNPKTNRKLRYDFYLPENNVLIEFDGWQHFKSNRKCWGGQERFLYESFRDGVKTDYAHKKGFNLIRIPYFKIDKISDILTQVVIKPFRLIPTN